MTGAPVLAFTCNVCGERVDSLSLADIGRESGVCPSCKASTRLRAIAYLVGKALFGRGFPVPQWPERPELHVLGVSDWPTFKEIYSPKVTYLNTQFDRDQFSTGTFLDVTKPGPEFVGAFDVVSCSEVLEHVEPPVQPAFDGLYSMLKPGGSLVFTVPYNLRKTVEHFPELHDWKLVAFGGKRKLVNITKDGRVQEFDDLCFHGGGESVLEMRLFGLDDIMRSLAEAGFVDARAMDQNVLEFGIYWPEPWSRAITATRAS